MSYRYRQRIEQLQQRKLLKEIKKIDIDTKIAEKNDKPVYKWLPISLQIIPTLFVAYLTYSVSQQNTALANTQAALSKEIQNNKGEAQIEKINLNKQIDAEKDAVENLKKTNYDYTLKNKILKTSNDSMHRLYDSIYPLLVREEEKEKGLIRTNKTLKIENKFVLYNEFLRLLKKFPYSDNGFTRELINRIKQGDEISTRLADSLKLCLSQNRLFGISSFILFFSLNDQKYYNNILNEIENRITNNFESFYTPLNANESEKNQILLNILRNPLWKLKNKIDFTIRIAEGVKNSHLTPFTYDLLEIPAEYNNESNLGLEEKNIQVLLQYLRINTEILYGKYEVPVLKKDTSKSIQLELYSQYQNEYEQYIDRKISILYNLTSFCPQFYTSYYFSVGSRVLQKGFFNAVKQTFNKPDEDKIFNFLMNDKNHFNLRTKELLQSVTSPKYQKIIDSFPDLEENISDDFFPKMFDDLKNFIQDAYKNKKVDIDHWMEKDLNYFFLNPNVLKKKMQSTTL